MRTNKALQAIHDMVFITWDSTWSWFKLWSAGKWTIETSPGWWFGTFFIFPYIGDNHPNWLIFFRGVETTNQFCSLHFYNVRRNLPQHAVLEVGLHQPPLALCWCGEGQIEQGCQHPVQQACQRHKAQSSSKSPRIRCIVMYCLLWPILLHLSRLHVVGFVCPP